MEGGKITFNRDAKLGEGAYGLVFRGEFEGRQVAVKRVLLNKINKTEEECLRKLKHPNIIKLFHSESDNDFRFYALELCDASLDQLFLGSDDPRKYNGPMPPHLEVFHQLALGLEYIHSNDLIHRDIKPENILISVRSTDRGDDVTIKWADFGLSKVVNERGTFTLSGIKGTEKWHAPESLKLLKNAQERKTRKLRGTVQSDVFVLCLVFGYLLLKGDHLYGSEGDNVEKNIKNGNPVNMQKINGKLREIYEDHLLTKMLEDDPNKRITSKEVVEQLNVIKKRLDEKEEELRQLLRTGDFSNARILKIKCFIGLGIDVNNDDGWNALHCLCRSNSSSNLKDAIQVLILLEIDVNAKDLNGWNALHCLCRYNSSSDFLDVIKILVRQGIDAKAVNEFGWNALHHLCWNNSSANLLEAIEVLIQLGIDVNARDNAGRNALLHLCSNNSRTSLIDAMELLIQLGIDVNARDYNERNALHHLCRNGPSSSLKDAIQLLIRHGIEVISNGNDARYLLHKNDRIRDKDEILKHLEEAVFAQEYIQLLRRRSNSFDTN
uniref:non-specific serine/threonine protein kinase n=1 Tax=Daphnia magna TaxID=35525 RepID=A0A0N8D375_9CRUS